MSVFGWAGFQGKVPRGGVGARGAALGEGLAFLRVEDRPAAKLGLAEGAAEFDDGHDAVLRAGAVEGETAAVGEIERL